jgi:hypothetical protein
MTDRAADFGVASALISIGIVIALTFVGLAAGTSDMTPEIASSAVLM